MTVVLCESKGVFPEVSNELNSDKFNINRKNSKKLVDFSDSDILLDSNRVAFPRKRSLQKKTIDIFIKDVKLWFRKLPPSLDLNDILAFEGSTSISLGISVFLSDKGYDSSNSSLTVKIVEQGEEYMVCDFKITIENSASSVTQIRKMFTELIYKSFGDEAFIDQYIRLLQMSSPTFKKVTDVSLTEWTPEPTSSPTTSLVYIEFDGLMMEFYGINQLRPSQKRVLKTITEEFLLKTLKSELDYEKFGNVQLEFSFSNKFVFHKLIMTMKISISVRAGLSIPMTDAALKYVTTAIFNDKKKDYLKVLSALQNSIYTYRITTLTSAPSLTPSTGHPSHAPTLRPSYSPSLSPSVVPSFFPSLVPTKSPSEKPSLDPSFWPSSPPSTIPSFVPSHIPSQNPSEAPSWPSDIPSMMPSFIPSVSPTHEPSVQPSSKPSHMPSNAPSKSPATFPSLVPSNLPNTLPSRYPSSAPSFSPYDRPTSTPTKKPSAVPSSFPTKSVIPSSIPSLVPSKSFLPTKYPTRRPTISPTMAPTSCEDDFTYRSRFGFACNIHSHSVCSKMNKAGFTLKEVDELIHRCRKSCDSCWLSANPSDVPSIVPSMVPSMLPSYEPSAHLTSTPTSLPSSLPNSKKNKSQQASKPNKEKSKKSPISSKKIIQTSPATIPPSYPKNKVHTSKPECFNDPSFADNTGHGCEYYRNVDCSKMTSMGLSEFEVNALISSCTDSCSTKCSRVVKSIPSTETINVDIASKNDSCVDNPLFQNRYGLTCLQHSDMVCERLVQIGFTDEEVKIIIENCKVSCKKCSASGDVAQPTVLNTDKEINYPSNAVAARVKGEDGNAPIGIMSFIVPAIGGTVLLLIVTIGLVMLRKRKSKELQDIDTIISRRISDISEMVKNQNSNIGSCSREEESQKKQYINVDGEQKRQPSVDEHSREELGNFIRRIGDLSGNTDSQISVNGSYYSNGESSHSKQVGCVDGDYKSSKPPDGLSGISLSGQNNAVCVESGDIVQGDRGLDIDPTYAPTNPSLGTYHIPAPTSPSKIHITQTPVPHPFGIGYANASPPSPAKLSHSLDITPPPADVSSAFKKSVSLPHISSGPKKVSWQLPDKIPKSMQFLDSFDSFESSLGSVYSGLQEAVDKQSTKGADLMANLQKFTRNWSANNLSDNISSPVILVLNKGGLKKMGEDSNLKETIDNANNESNYS
eukprot:CAMPEP_0194297804 /NCGR_PEP_ID=MMETSP0169-20130528/59808_1 /TAXON_ID=218684 /ORGANISM="Corethron pennatum, Strain L29A3" /LENGTH=1196 /DNA_ID=CAMNT_0039047711 /DNA_START=302 /DNA_END=3892 /DNA_ORIENTATION=-